MKSKDREQETIASIQMCSYIMNLSSDIEAIGIKLNVPHYRVRERDVVIKKKLKEIYDILIEEGTEVCNNATNKLVDMTDNKY